MSSAVSAGVRRSKGAGKTASPSAVGSTKGGKGGRRVAVLAEVDQPQTPPPPKKQKSAGASGALSELSGLACEACARKPGPKVPWADYTDDSEDPAKATNNRCRACVADHDANYGYWPWLQYCSHKRTDAGSMEEAQARQLKGGADREYTPDDCFQEVVSCIRIQRSCLALSDKAYKKAFSKDYSTRSPAVQTMKLPKEGSSGEEPDD